MYRFLFAALAACCAWHCATAAGEDRLDELFKTWSTTQAELRSLVVEFDTSTKHPVFESKTQKWLGTFKLLRMPDESISVACELGVAQVGHVPATTHVFLYSAGRSYVLELEKRQATLVGLTKDDAVRLTEEYLFPFAGMLERQHADANWNISIKSDNASITRIALEHKSRKRGGWLPTQVTRAEAIILNNGAGPCPQNIPSHFAIWGALKNGT